MTRPYLRRGALVAAMAVAALAAALAPSGSPAFAQQNAAVTIVNFAFQPAALTIPAGATVTWTNTGAAPHTASSDTAGVFDSGTLQTGRTFAFRFAQAGTFAYHCNIHPSMRATVTVQAAAGAAQATPARTATATAAPSPTRTATPAQAVSPTRTATPAATPARTATAVAAPGASAVRIVDFAFEPGSVTIPAGTTVTWTHAGQAPHTATSTDATKVFDSGRLNAGQTFSFKFDTPGTFAYRCDVHPGRMTGTIVVQGGGAAGAARAQAGAQQTTSAQAAGSDGSRLVLLGALGAVGIVGALGAGAWVLSGRRRGGNDGV